MPHNPRHPLLAVLLLALIEFSCSLDWMALSAVGGALMRDLALSPASYAILVSAGSVAAGVSGFLVAGFIDRFERRRVTEVMLAGLLLATILLTQVSNYWGLLGLRALAGVCGATAASQAYAMVADLFEPKRQAHAYAFVISGFSTSLGLGLPLAVFLEAHFGWHSIYYMISALLALTLLMVHLHIPVLEAHPGPAPWLQLKNMLSYRPHFLGLAMMSAVMGCGWILIPFVAPYFTYTLGLPPSSIALFYLYSGLSVVCCNFLISHLVKKWRVLSILYLAIAIVLPLQWLLTHLQPGAVTSAIVVAVAFNTLSVSRWNLCNQISSRHILPTMRGGMMSLSFALQESAGGLLVTMAGAMLGMQNGHITGYERVGYISIGFNLALILLARRLEREPVQAP